MAIDTNVFNGAVKPMSVMDYDNQALLQQQKQQGLQTNALLLQQHQMEAEKYKRGLADDGVIRNALMGAAPTLQGRTAALEATGLPAAYGQADALRKAELGNQKTGAEIDEQRAKAAAQVLDVYAKGANVIVQNPQQWESVVGALEQATGQPSPARQLFQSAQGDPAKISQIAASLGQTYQQAMQEQTTRDTNAATNLTSRQNNAATVAATMRGQNMTDARSREQLGQSKVPAGYRMNADGTMTAIPGGPADPNAVGGGKLTEDQGKATGWLVQANNAYGNMKAAATSTPSAVKPGFPDVVAAVPGMAGVANSMRGADRQKFMQASSSLSEALLRAATGAGVNHDEAVQKVQELTPVFGEDAATTKQKFDAIPLYIESLKVRAGPGASRAANIGTAPAASAAAHPADIDQLLKKYSK